jgi:hypothetical protein
LKSVRHIVLVFLWFVLISYNGLYAQSNNKDTIVRTAVDTLVDNETLESKIDYKAKDSIVYLAQKKIAILYGEANVVYESMNITASAIEIDYSSNIITAYGMPDSTGKLAGTPVFKDDDQEMNAEKIMYNLRSKKGKIFNALTKQGELFVFGNQIKKDSNDVIYMQDMKCIPCEFSDSRTVFRATRAKIIPNDKIVSGPMYLEIGGVPTPLGLPFGFFPNTKKAHNGILLPQYGSSGNFGRFLKDGGYYLGINDMTDMVIKGDIYSNGSWAVRTTNNYNVLYKAVGSVNIGFSYFIIGDKDLKPLGPTKYSKQQSYSIAWQHRQDNKNNPKVNFSANVNYQNQLYNKYNAVNTGQYLQSVFQSNVNFTRSYKVGALSLNATHSQNTNTKQVDISFPQLTFNVNRFYPFKREGAVKQNILDKIGINYLLEARNTLSGYDSTIFKGNIDDRMKYGIKHSLPISTNFNVFKYVTVTPGLNLSSVMYTRSIRKEHLLTAALKDSIADKTVYGFAGGYDANFSTALNTKVFFDYSFFGKRLKQIRHLLIPTLTYLYRPDLGAEQYGFWKKVQTDTLGNTRNYSIFEKSLFAGPALGKQNSLAINLNNNVEGKIKHVSDTGVSYKKIVLIQNLSLNTSYNFAADSFQMNNIVVSARNKLFRYFDVVVNATFDPYGFDKTTQRRVKQYAKQYDGTLARFLTANFAVNASFGSNDLLALQKAKQAPDLTNGAERGTKQTATQETLPWNLSMFYSYNVSPDPKNAVSDANTNSKFITNQALNFSGDIAPTKYWKVGITSGYDFIAKGISYTSFDIYRDLKCWEARIGWVPFGFRKSYNFSINIKSSMFSDMKASRLSPPALSNDFNF